MIILGERFFSKKCTESVKIMLICGHTHLLIKYAWLSGIQVLKYGKRGGDDIYDVIKVVYFNWAFWPRGFQLSGSKQIYTGKTYLHIITMPGGMLE